MSYIAERRLEEKDRRRAEILDAAEAVAAEEGMDALTMDQVARRARLSRALLYVYFADKSDLHFALCDRGLALLGDRFKAAVARHRTGLAQIEAMGRAYVNFAHKFPVYFEVLARFQASDSQAADAAANQQACMAAGERVHRIMIEAVSTGIRDGSISNQAGSPVSVAMTLWGFMHGIIQLTATKGDVLSQYGLSGKALVEQALHLAGRGLARS